MESIAALLASRGLVVERVSERRLVVRSPAGATLIKPAHLDHLDDHAFLVAEPIPGIEIVTSGRFFRLGDRLYQATPLDPRLRPASSLDELLAIDGLYRHRDRIIMLGEFADLDRLVLGPHPNKDDDKGQGHPAGPSASLDRVVEIFRRSTAEIAPRRPERLARGLHHGDLISDNILVGPDGLHVIDLDPILHTYAALNLAHFFAAEILAKPQNHRYFGAVRARFVGALEADDAESFDFFVLLALWRALVRRAFQKHIFHDDWEEDLLWYFQRFGQDGYLSRVR